MPDETNIQRIVDYMRQYLADYEPEQLRQQLLAAGYLPDDIDLAFARLAPSDAGVATAQIPDEDAGDAAQIASEFERMLAYLRQHRDRYSLEALRTQLLAAGKSPALIEQAIARLQAEQPVQHRPRRWPQIIGLAILNTLLLPVVAYLLAIIFGTSADAPVTATLITGPGLLFVELIAGVALLFRERTAWLGKSLLLSVAISVVLTIIIVVVAVVLLAGTCLVMLRNL